MLDPQEYEKLFQLLEDVDREITEIHDAGFPTSPLTDALDSVYEYAIELKEA